MLASFMVRIHFPSFEIYDIYQAVVELKDDVDWHTIDIHRDPVKLAQHLELQYVPVIPITIVFKII